MNNRQNWFLLDYRYRDVPDGWISDEIELDGYYEEYRSGLKIVDNEYAFLSILRNIPLRPIFIPRTSVIKYSKSDFTVTDKAFVFEILDTSNVDVVRYLCENGGRPIIRDGFDPLLEYEVYHHYTIKGNLPVLKYLLEYRPLYDHHLSNLLRLASEFKREDIKDYLISIGVK